MESAERSLFYGSGEYSCLDVIVMMIYRDKRIDFLPGFGCFCELKRNQGSIISRGRIFILEDVFARCSQYFSAIFFRQKPFRLEEDYKL